MCGKFNGRFTFNLLPPMRFVEIFIASFFECIEVNWIEVYILRGIQKKFSGKQYFLWCFPHTVACSYSGTFYCMKTARMIKLKAFDFDVS